MTRLFLPQIFFSPDISKFMNSSEKPDILLVSASPRLVGCDRILVVETLVSP